MVLFTVREGVQPRLNFTPIVQALTMLTDLRYNSCRRIWNWALTMRRFVDSVDRHWEHTSEARWDECSDRGLKRYDFCLGLVYS